ncbi:hypothetical protein BH11PSE5_BH11PSE5_20710 [soil metagenome]
MSVDNIARGLASQAKIDGIIRDSVLAGVMEGDISSGLRHGKPGNWSVASEAPSFNAARYTEDLTWLYAVAIGTLVKSGQIEHGVIDDGQAVLFHRVAGYDFYAGIEHRYSNGGLNPFKAGQRYLLSFYVFSPREQWFWTRPMTTSSDFGHGPKYVPANTIRRVWSVVHAIDSARLDLGTSPTVAFGNGTLSSPYILGQGFVGTMDLWIGGIQIEPIGNTYVDGIALIGDSTDAGGSGAKDYPKDFRISSNREISTVIAADLNCNLFNRAVGGESLPAMDARWATDITPLKSRSWGVLITGGVNDVNGGRTLAQMQANIQSMVAKATADGLVPMFRTISPFLGTEADSAKAAARNAYNSWLLSAHGNMENGGAVVDISSVCQDPLNTNALHSADYGDGTHFSGMLKTEIGKFMAKRIAARYPDKLITPKPYRRVDPKSPNASQPGTVTSPLDKSGAITTGGTSQKLLDASITRRGWVFHNISDTDMWINELGAAAVADSPSVRVAAGTTYRPDFQTVSQVNVLCATTGKKFTAREW